MVDLDNAVIVDVEPTVSISSAETLAARRMIDRIHDRFGLFPKKLVGNTGYGSAEMLGRVVEERGIEPHILVRDKSKWTGGTFSREDFAHDNAAGQYICPDGHTLRRYRRNLTNPRPPKTSKDAQSNIMRRSKIAANAH